MKVQLVADNLFNPALQPRGPAGAEGIPESNPDVQP